MDSIQTNNEVTNLCLLIRGIENRDASIAPASKLSAILTDEIRGKNVGYEKRVEALTVLMKCFVVRSVNWQHHLGLIPVAIDTLLFWVDYWKDIDNNDEEMACSCLLFLINMARTRPGFFNMDVCPVIRTLFKVFRDGDANGTTRIQAGRALNYIAISRNHEDLNRFLFRLAVGLLLDQDEFANVLVGQCVLGIIAANLSEGMARYYVKLIKESLVDVDWKHRKAAMLAFSEIGNRCNQLIGDVMNDIIPLIISGFIDNQSTVRYTAVRCIGALYSSNVPGQWRERCLDRVINPVIHALDDATDDARQEAAIETVSLLIPKCDPRHLFPNLEALLTPLSVLPGNPELPADWRLIACKAIADLATTAALSSEGTFTTFYEMLTPEVIEILEDDVEGRRKAKKAWKIVSDYIRKRVNMGERMAGKQRNLGNRRGPQVEAEGEADAATDTDSEIDTESDTKTESEADA